MVQQDVHVECHHHSVDVYSACIQAVDDDTVELGNDHLAVVDCEQRNQTQQEPSGVLEIITVYVLAEYHCWYLFLSFFY